jgi:hypothetical protein
VSLDLLDHFLNNTNNAADKPTSEAIMSGIHRMYSSAFDNPCVWVFRSEKEKPLSIIINPKHPVVQLHSNVRILNDFVSFVFKTLYAKGK